MMCNIDKHNWTGSLIELTSTKSSVIDLLKCNHQDRLKTSKTQDQSVSCGYSRSISESSLIPSLNNGISNTRCLLDYKSSSALDSDDSKLSEKTDWRILIVSFIRKLNLCRNQRNTNSDTITSTGLLLNGDPWRGNKEQNALHEFYPSNDCEINQKFDLNEGGNSCITEATKVTREINGHEEQTSKEFDGSTISENSTQFVARVDTLMENTDNYRESDKLFNNIDVLSHLNPNDKSIQNNGNPYFNVIDIYSSTDKVVNTLGSEISDDNSFILDAKTSSSKIQKSFNISSTLASLDQLCSSDKAAIQNTMSFNSNVDCKLINKNYSSLKNQDKINKECLSTDETHPSVDITTTTVKKKNIKKSVRFADDLGGELYVVLEFGNKTSSQKFNRYRNDSFDDEFGNFEENNHYRSSYRRNLPTKTLSISKSYEISSERSINSKTLSTPISCPATSWYPTFIQPAAQYFAFRQRLESNCVSLENISISTTDGDSKVRLYGTVKVKNIYFEKRIWLRLTVDYWKTFKDYDANYDQNMSINKGIDDRFDTFVFQFLVDGLDSKREQPSSTKIEFVVGFQAGTCLTIFWDNNDGNNYVITKNFMPREQSAMLLHSNKMHKSALTQRTNTNILPQKHMSSENSLGSIIHLDNPYTLDYRPNFKSFPTLTEYSSCKHYSEETLYY